MSLNLKVKTEQTHHVDFLTYAWMREEDVVGFDEFIADCYGLDKPMEISCGNDTNHSVNVEPEEPFYDFDKDQLADIKRTGFMEEYQLRLVLCDLCHSGHLPEGKYVVTMSW